MATILENEAAWSTTAATNSNVDTGINWAEGQDPATVNNSARGMMAARAKARLDLGGGLAAGGTANALTVTTNEVLSSGHITAGTRLLIRATADNTSTTVTFAPDSLTAANIKRADGSALGIGSIKSGGYLDLVYNSGSSEWRAVNIEPIPVGASLGSALASFSALLAGDQTGIASVSPTTVAFATEVYDIGGLYDNATYAWYPPAGRCIISGSVFASDVTAANFLTVVIYKNGSQFRTGIAYSGTTTAVCGLTMQDSCNGTDYYQLLVQGVTAGTLTAKSSLATYFMGSMI